PGIPRSRLPSEVQSSLARTLGESLHASVEQVTGAVEDHALDAGLLGGRGERLAHLGRLAGLVALEAEPGPRGGDDRLPAVVVDELRKDAAVRAVHREAGPLGGAADLAAHAAVPAKAGFASRQAAHSPPSRSGA